MRASLRAETVTVLPPSAPAPVTTIDEIAETWLEILLTPTEIPAAPPPAVPPTETAAPIPKAKITASLLDRTVASAPSARVTRAVPASAATVPSTTVTATDPAMAIATAEAAPIAAAAPTDTVTAVAASSAASSNAPSSPMFSVRSSPRRAMISRFITVTATLIPTPTILEPPIAAPMFTVWAFSWPSVIPASARAAASASSSRLSIAPWRYASD